ncbi:MAG: hypothetical protein ACI85F_000119, partial [Bacteroidia bacterium]
WVIFIASCANTPVEKAVVAMKDRIINLKNFI